MTNADEVDREGWTVMRHCVLVRVQRIRYSTFDASTCIHIIADDEDDDKKILKY